MLSVAFTGHCSATIFFPEPTSGNGAYGRYSAAGPRGCSQIFLPGLVSATWQCYGIPTHALLSPLS